MFLGTTGDIRLARTAVLAAGILVLATIGCAQKTPDFCASSADCLDLARPFCDVNGQYPASDFTGNTCIADPTLPDAGPTGAPDAGPEAPDGGGTACRPSEAVCSDGTLIVCDEAGQMSTMVDCPLGCNANAARCYDVDPSNGVSDLYDLFNNPPAIVLDDATIDTDTGEILDGGQPVLAPTMTIAQDTGPEIFGIRVASLTVGDLTITGARPLAIASDGDIVINGIVDIDAGRVEDCGPQDPIGGDTQGSYCKGRGGGGGGFGTAGGIGGSTPDTAGGMAGTTVGSTDLVPLRGGCSGGGHELPGAAGLGGGGLQLVSRTRITLSTSGAVDANGQGGVSVLHQGCSVDAHAVGGGSGGAILVEAPVVTLERGSGLFANGGGGACRDDPGENGKRSNQPALGGDCTTSPSGSGGAGASATAPAENGEASPGNHTVRRGGAGGGGVGRIRINNRLGGLTEDGAVVSPAQSMGSIGTR